MLKRHGLKKGLSLVLVLCLILSLMPTVAMAQEPTAVTDTETTVGVTDGETPAGTETSGTAGAEGGNAETGDTAGTEGGNAETGDTAGSEGGNAETGDTAGSEGGNAETGGTVGTEDETEKDDPLDDFLDDVLKPLPGDTGTESGNGNETTQPDDGETPNIPTEDVNGEKPEAPEGTVTPDPNPQDPSTAPSDDFPTILPVFPSEEDPAELLPPEELLPEVPEDTTVTTEVTTETNEPITITVTGPGLTSLTVEAVPSVTTLPVEPAQEQVDYVAYDVTPMVGDVPYTESADVTIPVPADWDEDAEIYGFVVNGEDAEEPVTVIKGVRNEDGTFTFTAPHFSIMGLYAEPQPLYTGVENVSVNVGDSKTITVQGQDLRDLVNRDELDDSIATVEVTTEDIKEGSNFQVLDTLEGTFYISDDSKEHFLTVEEGYYGADVANTDKKEDAIQWSYENGYLVSENGYYLGYTTRPSFSGWYPSSLKVVSDQRNAQRWEYDGQKFAADGYSAYYITCTTNDYYIGSYTNWSIGTSGTSGAAYADVKTEARVDTVIKITGVSEGTTSVIVGDTQYNITVVDQAPAGALTGNSLTVEYWITNSTVTAEGARSLTISRNEASTDGGVEIASLVPADGVRTGTEIEVMFWQAVRLDIDNHQTGDSGDDETADGTVFTWVRYNTDQGAWQYYGQDNVWHWFYATDQAVAYYLQVTDVTKEVTTTTKDWGYDLSKGQTDNTSEGVGQVALSVAVVYADGMLSPKEEEIYLKSTTIFNYWDETTRGHDAPRDIGILAALNNSDYEVTKITVTNGTRDEKFHYNDNVWYSDDSITWEKEELEDGSLWYKEKVCWTESDGGVPTINGETQNITWSGKNTAKLVLIYIQPIKKETNLNVVWYDDSAKNNIYSTQVVVSGTGNETFFNSLKQSSTVPQQGGEFTLDDEAYVVNRSNVHQTFSKNLATLQGDIAAQYRSGLYKYVKAELSADGKTLTLHYQIDDSKLDHRYVVDFGLPVKVPLSDLVEKVETVASVTISETTLAKVESDKSITFQPDAVMDAEMVITANLAFTGGGSQDIKIGFVPASTMYYEEGFMTLESGFTGNPSTGTKNQETSKLGEGDVYGYDAAYANETGPSNGSQVTSNTAGSTATFSFKGTGVDIYANCGSDTGVVMIKVCAGSKLIKLLTVDTAMVDGVTDATKGQSVTAYNIPIASIDGLDYGEYEVEIVHVADKNKEVKPVYLDGFRVHQPLGISGDNNYYGADTEAGAKISELRDAVLRVQLSLNASDSEKYKDQLANAKAQVYAMTGDEGASAVVLSYAQDGDVAIDILDNGPKNEIYLGQNETLVFRVAETAQNVQVGLKNLTGSGNCTVNGKMVTSSTDMFYQVTPEDDGMVTIKNTGTGILSVTELKIASGN